MGVPPPEPAAKAEWEVPDACPPTPTEERVFFYAGSSGAESGDEGDDPKNPLPSAWKPTDQGGAPVNPCATPTPKEAAIKAIKKNQPSISQEEINLSLSMLDFSDEEDSGGPDNRAATSASIRQKEGKPPVAQAKREACPLSKQTRLDRISLSSVPDFADDFEMVSDNPCKVKSLQQYHLFTDGNEQDDLKTPTTASNGAKNSTVFASLADMIEGQVKKRPAGLDDSWDRQ